jgi:hypothetical protein
VCLAPTDPNDQSDPLLLDFSVLHPTATGGAQYGNTHFGASITPFDGVCLILTDIRYGLFDSPGMVERSSPGPLIARS